MVVKEEFIKKADEAKKRGFNIYALVTSFQKVRKLREKIPASVVEAVLDEFLKNGEKVTDHWPYFVVVLRRKSEKYFSTRNAHDGENFKKERANSMVIGEILKRMSSEK